MPARVSSNLELEFADEALTSYAGLELFGNYRRASGFIAAVHAAFADAGPWSDFGATAIVRLVIGLLVVGGQRRRHVAFVQDDPVVRRFCEVRVVPTARTLSRWWKGLTIASVDRLQQINMQVTGRMLGKRALRIWAIDVDAVVVSTGLQVERAFRGFNPHHREVPSYYPMMVHLAEAPDTLRVKNG